MTNNRKAGIDCKKKKPLQWAIEHKKKWQKDDRNKDKKPLSLVGFCLNDKKNTTTGTQLEALIDGVKKLSGENYIFYIEINDPDYYEEWKNDNAKCLKNVRLTDIHDIQRGPHWVSFNAEYAKSSGELEVSLADDVRECLERQPTWNKPATEEHCRLTAKYIGNMMLADNKEDGDTLTFIWYPNRFSDTANKVVEFVLKHTDWNVRSNIMHFHYDINNLEGLYNQQKQLQCQQQGKTQVLFSRSSEEEKTPALEMPMHPQLLAIFTADLHEVIKDGNYAAYAQMLFSVNSAFMAPHTKKMRPEEQKTSSPKKSSQKKLFPIITTKSLDSEESASSPSSSPQTSPRLQGANSSSYSQGSPRLFILSSPSHQTCSEQSRNTSANDTSHKPTHEVVRVGGPS